MNAFQKLFKGTPDKPIVQGAVIQDHAIEFSLWKDDLPLEIQLEPECYLFRVEPGNELKFVAASGHDFTWSLRIDIKSGGVQLFPEGKGDYKIRVFENAILLDDWFKYMH